MTKEELQDVILSFTNDVLLDYPEHDTILLTRFIYTNFCLATKILKKCTTALRH